MEPNEGRLQTAEHILVKILRDRFDVAVGISKFGEDSGLLEVVSQKDLRLSSIKDLEDEVNKIIRQNLNVKKYMLSREEAAKAVSLGRLPPDVKEVRIVDIEGFYASACKDPHVDNTGEVGIFRLRAVERVGKDRYRFTFKTE